MCIEHIYSDVIGCTKSYGLLDYSYNYGDIAIVIKFILIVSDLFQITPLLF